MKPWTKQRQIAAALTNADVRIGERVLPDGTRLRGLYAARAFAPDDYVASFHGQVISRAMFAGLHSTDRARFEKVAEYALGTPEDGHLMPDDLDALGAHLINHSCGPNTKWGHTERGARLVRAIRPVAAGQELTVHYGWLGIKAAHEGSWHPCACDAPMCVGTIELRVEMIREGDTGGPRLAPEEVAARLLADILNDTDAHEALLCRYGTDSMDLFIGAEVISRLDPVAFFNKLRGGARTAILKALALKAQGRAVSERRLHQIMRTYRLPR